jgi:two-component system sensor histidine kinase/response regulator
MGLPSPNVPPAVTTPAHPRKILVVEDNLEDRTSLANLLEAQGHQCLTADNGVDGLLLARVEMPDLIITDIALPRMDGFELIERIRRIEELRAIPVIILSAKQDRTALRHGMELGADDYITKPYTNDEVVRSIAARLEKKDLVDELDAFAHTVAHDLKNPLATLVGRIGLIELTLGQMDEATMRKHLTEAGHAAHRLSTIIEELLVLAGVRRHAFKVELLDTAALVKEALARIDHQIRRYGANVTLPETWVQAYGFHPWVVHIWSNYLSNAAKYGGTNPDIVLGSEINPQNGHARFWVQDRGPGLDEATRAKLFVPFNRISSVRSVGHGLGLSIVARIVGKLNGHAGVESTPGAGARFWFELPTQPPQAPKPITVHPFLPSR